MKKNKESLYSVICRVEAEEAVYDSRGIANKFIQLAAERGELLTPMQLIKLVYIAHGWMLGLYHKPLISDEVQAWPYGPVVPRLYNVLKGFKGTPVAEPVRASNETLDPVAENLLTQIYDRYGKLSGPALSRLTHAPGTPWHLAYVPGGFGLTIPVDLIEDHYARLAATAA